MQGKVAWEDPYGTYKYLFVVCPHSPGIKSSKGVVVQVLRSPVKGKQVVGGFAYPWESS